jgi:hypothetical protein
MIYVHVQGGVLICLQSCVITPTALKLMLWEDQAQVRILVMQIIPSGFPSGFTFGACSCLGPETCDGDDRRRDTIVVMLWSVMSAMQPSRCNSMSM